LLVARLFNNSFDSASVVQDFALNYEDESLMNHLVLSNSRLGYRSRAWASIMHNDFGLNVFNSTTVASHALSGLVKLLDRSEKKLASPKPVSNLWSAMYSKLTVRLVSRRTGNLTRIPKSVTRDVIKKSLDANRGFPLLEAQGISLSPLYGVPNSPKFAKAATAKMKKILGNGMPWGAIKYATCPEDFYFGDYHYEWDRLEVLKNELVKRNPGTDWFSWAPYAKGPRKKKKL
jgi:hypothetical protein